MFLVLVLSNLLLLIVLSPTVQSLPIAFDIQHYMNYNNLTSQVTVRATKKSVQHFGAIDPMVDVKLFEGTSSKNVSHTFDDQNSKLDKDRIRFLDEVGGDLEEGSPCKRSADDSDGYCLLSTQCRHVMEEFKVFGTKINICGYDGLMPLVCCPLGVRREISNRVRKRKRPSARYCEEYSELGKSNGAFVRLTSRPEIVKTEEETQCNSPIRLIVGGESAVPGEFPHMAAIGWTKSDNTIKWSCGGSLISEKFVLTAAHCGEMRGKAPNVVRLGSHELTALSSKTTQNQDFQIRRIIKYPKYEINSYYNDIALIQLQRSVKFNQYIRPACLWQSSNFDFKNAIATGWGRLGFHGRRAKDLQKVELNLIDRNLCNNSFRSYRELHAGIVDSQICAGYMDGGKDTCQGDSGGPLQVTLPNNQCVYHIIGVTSFGKFCAAPDTPGVYTNIYSYLDWIEDNVFRIVV